MEAYMEELFNEQLSKKQLMTEVWFYNHISDQFITHNPVFISFFMRLLHDPKEFCLDQDFLMVYGILKYIMNQKEVEDFLSDRCLKEDKHYKIINNRYVLTPECLNLLLAKYPQSVVKKLYHLNHRYLEYKNKLLITALNEDIEGFKNYIDDSSKNFNLMIEHSKIKTKNLNNDRISLENDLKKIKIVDKLFDQLIDLYDPTI